MFDHRLILLATPRQIGVLDWRPGQMHWLGEYANDTAGLAAFRQLVVRHAQLPVLLVVDTVDEDYRSEVLPHVQGRARAELLARKLKQVFRNARFTGAWRQARETAGRRDDRYLLAALPDAEWLTPWLSVLHREQVPLAGITPLAVAYQHLLSRLRAQEPHVLLACRLNNSLRLSYYQNGLLRFSRLIGSDTPTQFPGNAADEIAKTQLYLTGQRILPREARLQVLLLDPSGQLDSAQAPLNADPAFRVQMIDMASLARALRIPDAYLAATPEVAPLAAIAGESLLLNLAPPELLQRHTEFRWRRGLHWAAGLIAAASLTLTASYWLHAQDLLNEAQKIGAEAQRGDARHAAIVKNFPALATRPDQLGHTLALAQQIEQTPFDLNALYVPLGQALSAHPEVMVKVLTLAQLSDRSADITLDAQLADFDGNYRAAMQRIDGFVATLASAPGVLSVERVSSPINTASTATLSGRTTGNALPEETRFSVNLQVRP
ncbi:MAG: monoheme cytochrome SoxX [Thiobacillus sp.]|uniref:monoheme cytochrome SoxX n=1 Tax=Thiobacillus sp. TaxID=924 RepID=UPI0027359014|nr:monoheme cytochrome SoxX [Thiobacillus sp.]MDP3586284.1 monoheme cytochrome SoxX [Thiobacillus sp.]